MDEVSVRGVASGDAAGPDGRPSLEWLTGLAARIGAAASVVAVSQARLLAWIGEFDAHDGAARVESGWGGTTGWLQFRCAMTPVTAREHVRVARALRRMPTLTAVFEAGRVSYSQVRAATRLVDVVDDAHLSQLALTLTAGELERAVASFRRTAGHRLLQEQKRHASWRTDADGWTRVTICLPAEEGALVRAAIEAARDRQPAGDGANPDAVLDLARTYLAVNPDDVSGADRTSVIVIVDASQLAAAAAAAGSGAMLRVDAAPEPPHVSDRDVSDSDGVDVSAETWRGVLDLPWPQPAPDLPGMTFGPDGLQHPTWGAPHTRHPIDTHAGDVSAETPQRSRAEAEDPERDPDHTAEQPDPDASTETPRAARTGTPTPGLPTPAGIAAARTALRAGLCHLPGHGGIEPATAARLACDHPLVGLIIATDGDVLHHGRTRRLVSPAQRRALQLRDHHSCRFPGCPATRHLDAHHITHWAAGGPTDLDNLLLLCPRHHTWVHEGGITITHHPGPGPHPQWTFHLPNGHHLHPGSDALTDQPIAQILHWHTHNTTVDSLHDTPARRLTPKTGGTPFSLAPTIDALFQMQLTPPHAA